MQAHVQELRDTGVTRVPGVYSQAQCARFIETCRRIAGAGPAADTHNIWNFFRHDPDLFALVSNEPMDAILQAMMGEDYTLTAANVINRQQRNGNASKANYAADWHTDSRYVGDERLDKGFCFSVVIMLDDFSSENGATHYIPGTHKDRIKPERHGDYRYEVLTGRAGDMVIMDSGVWHRGGPSSQQSRWGVFNLYSPWYVKPYFDFPAMMGEDFGKTASPLLHRLLHYASQPPRDETVRINTLQKTCP